MKAISILQPWASLVALGHKKIETRSWNTKYRGELLIHASMGKKKEGALLMNSTVCQKAIGNTFLSLEDHLWLNDLPFGAIIGKVNLEAVIQSENIDSSADPFQQSMLINSDRSRFTSNCATISPQELAFGDYSPNRFGWLLSDPVLFENPIPCKGQLGIWNFDPRSILNSGISHVQFTHDQEPSIEEVLAINAMYEKAKHLKA